MGAVMENPRTGWTRVLFEERDSRRRVARAGGRAVQILVARAAGAANEQPVFATRTGTHFQASAFRKIFNDVRTDLDTVTIGFEAYCEKLAQGHHSASPNAAGSM